MKKIIILSGSETRHEFFRKTIAKDEKIDVLVSFCEGIESSLSERVKKNINSSKLEKDHVIARNQSEKDFFELINRNMNDYSNPVFIKKGAINEKKIVDKIIGYNPDLIICYGSSLIKSRLIKLFKNRFINVHLGLSPYYRGSGTNVWPLINGEPEMVGATFMHLDEGIDTGRIIHQIRAQIFLGDSPHSIGNRLIKNMTFTFKSIILNYDFLEDVKQPENIEGKFYLAKDFNFNSCKKLYQNFNNGLIDKHINNDKKFNFILDNPGLEL